ncbi:MAG: hypothetical protein ACLFNS_09915 [Desulfobacterales bacterium]
MKRTLTLIITLIFVLAGAGLGMAEMHQQGEAKQMPEQSEMQQRHSSEQQMEWFCPWCGSQRGTEMGQGMMGDRQMKPRGRGMNHGWSRGECPRGKSKQMAPIKKEEAKTLMNNYVAGNPNLKIGEVTEEDDSYVGEIVTKDGSLVETLVVDKKTGWMKRKY